MVSFVTDIRAVQLLRKRYLGEPRDISKEIKLCKSIVGPIHISKKVIFRYGICRRQRLTFKLKIG